jgi:trans-2-enoyl-CoA reductase
MEVFAKSETTTAFVPSWTHPIMAFRASLVRANRAIVYTQTGDPSQVLSALTYKSLPPPPPETVNIKYLLAPINPADVNVIQGVYPAKPSLVSLAEGNPVFVGGNEGLAEVTQVGTGVSGLAAGDWVVMTKAQAGTWSSSRNVGAMDVLKLPRADGLTEVHGATMTVCAAIYHHLGFETSLSQG